MSHPANDIYLESRWEVYQEIPELLKLASDAEYRKDEIEKSKYLGKAVHLYRELLEEEIDLLLIEFKEEHKETGIIHTLNWWNQIFTR